jgi:UPF0755 protein
MRRLGLAALLVLVAAGAGCAGLYRAYTAPGPLPAAIAIVVPRGGLTDVAAALRQRDAIASPLLFRALAVATTLQGPLRAGELPFPAAASLRDVLHVLRTARPVQHRLTIPEGLTAAQVAELVNGADALTGDAPVPAEGTILPETYSYERGTSREQVMDWARIAMDRAVDKAWDSRAPGLPLASKAEAVVLASMIERETAKPEERPLIAAVFLNRLRLGMKLQSDPTVVYAVSGGLGVLDHKLTRADLDHDDPYNTYRIAALPPGPICMPGLASLHAATHPAATDALFFVADGTGGHVFARSEDDHLRNVAHWRDIMRTRAAAASGALQ